MQRLIHALNSRGWAAIVLTGGVTLALPFFRSQPVRDSAEPLEGNSFLSGPLQSGSQLTHRVKSDLSASSTATELPSPVKPSSLPNWVADAPPPMQTLLKNNQSFTSKPEADHPVHLPLQPLRPWVDEPSPLIVGNTSGLQTNNLFSDQVATYSSPWNTDSSSTPQTEPATSSRIPGWPDERIRPQELNQLVQGQNHHLKPLKNDQLSYSSIQSHHRPIQPASLERVDEPNVNLMPNADRQRYFIFQPGMKR